jgi:chorismate mutase/5-enolpyruvylshikimate-3-phosphate synthase
MQDAIFIRDPNQEKPMSEKNPPVRAHSGYSPGQPPRLSPAEEVSALDDELIRLLAKRSKLIVKMRGGKTHAASPASIRSEKQIRRNWEAKAGRISRDNRFIRQLFNLIQDLSIQQADLPAAAPALSLYNLAPLRAPVRLTLAGPGLEEEAMLWVALAAALNVEMQIDGVQRTRGMSDFFKAFSGAGADLSWHAPASPETEDLWMESLLTRRPGHRSVFGAGGMAVYVGESALAFYLLALLHLDRPGKKRFTGAHALKNTDLSALYRMLPELGARLAFSVPGSRALPAAVESSGTLPPLYTVPADLPLEAILALLLSAFVWKRPLVLNLENLPSAVAYRALSIMTPFFAAFAEAAEVAGTTVHYKNWAGPADRLSVRVALNPELSTYILGLPFFTGGAAALAGNWGELPESAACIALLRKAGLKVELAEGGISSSHQGLKKQLAADEGPLEALLCQSLPENLLPLFWVFNAALAARAKPADGLLLRQAPQESDLDAAEDLLAQFGLALQKTASGLLITPLPPEESAVVAAKTHGWSSMSPYWTLAFSLGAFFKANLKLSNPDTATDICPGYWALYNSLPDPSPKKSPAESIAKRRRIIAQTSIDPPADLTI